MTSLAPLLPLAESAPGAVDPARKVFRAAQDFESVLLGEMLRSLEKSLSAVPGEATDAGADNYQYLGTEALASALAARGGLGIARLITRSLLKSQQITSDREAAARPLGR